MIFERILNENEHYIKFDVEVVLPQEILKLYNQFGIQELNYQGTKCKIGPKVGTKSVILLKNNNKIKGGK